MMSSMVRTPPSLSLTASFHTPAHPKIPLSPLFATLTGNPHKSKKTDPVTPLFSVTRSHSSSLFLTLFPVSPVCPEFAEGPVIDDPLFLQSFVHSCKKCFRLTSFFSTKPSHSSSLFITLFPVSPVFATLSKSTPGYTPLPQSM